MKPLKAILLKITLIREKMASFEISFNFNKYTPMMPITRELHD